MKNTLLIYLNIVPVLIVLNLIAIGLNKNLNQLEFALNDTNEYFKDAEKHKIDIIIPQNLVGVKVIYASTVPFLKKIEFDATIDDFSNEEIGAKRNNLKAIFYKNRQKNYNEGYIVEQIKSLGLDQFEIDKNTSLSIFPKFKINNYKVTINEISNNISGTILNEDSVYLYRDRNIDKLLFISSLQMMKAAEDHVSSKYIEYYDSKSIEFKEEYISCKKEEFTQIGRKIEKIFIESCVDYRKISLYDNNSIGFIGVNLIDSKKTSLSEFNEFLERSNLTDLNKIEIRIDTSFYKKYIDQLEEFYANYSGKAELKLCFK